MSATKAIGTSDGGFAIAGSALLTPGVQGLRLARYDADATLRWARQYDVDLTFATINPPANAIQTGDGGFILSVAALSGLEPVQRVVRVDGSGDLGCGSTPFAGPLVFEVESTVAPVAVSDRTVLAFWLTFVEQGLEVQASPDCPGPGGP